MLIRGIKDEGSPSLYFSIIKIKAFFHLGKSCLPPCSFSCYNNYSERMKKQIGFFAIIFCAVFLVSGFIYADDLQTPDVQGIVDSISTPKTSENTIQATCAQQVFAQALIADAASVNEDSPEVDIQAWIYKNFQSPNTIQKVLNCTEISQLADDDTMTVPPVEYRFPAGRKIVVNYETQPKILKQRLLIANKRAIPCTTDDCISPKIGAANDPNLWTNTEPAWYGILVVQAGALDPYIGEEKNNVIALKYIEENVDIFYPHNYNKTLIHTNSGPRCTSRSAFANDSDIVNLATTKSVGIESYGDEDGDGQKDTNDYYVAGDVNLQWVAWSEIALDVVITVATVGGGTILIGATKGLRAAKAAKNLAKSIKVLKEADAVKDYISLVNKASKAAEELKAIDKVTDAAKWAKKSDEIKDLEKTIKETEKVGDVKKYKEAVSTFGKIQDLRRGMKAWKIPQRGNVIARSWRVAKNFTKLLRSGKTISKAERVARAGMKSGKLRNWLFVSTMKNVGRLARMERQAGILYGAMTLIEGAYDWTETSTGEFSSNIELKPFCLLSADDLPGGQDNIVNYGMWLMWAGDSLSAEDDDAAFLQAMDFANKFHQDMQETQYEETEKGRSNNDMCDVDIFVVRPIIKNPDSDNPELYYLIMNDVPWSIRTAE